MHSGVIAIHTRCIRKVAGHRKQWLDARVSLSIACRGYQQLAEHAASRPDVHTEVIQTVEVQRELRGAAVTSQVVDRQNRN